MVMGGLSCLAVAAACSGADPNAKIHSPPLDAGVTASDGSEPDTSTGESSGGRSSSSSGGRVCPFCEVDDDCTSTCGPTPTDRYIWCCGGGSCYEWSSASCPDATSTPILDATAGGG